jgi:striatin 1/3/4
MAPPPQEYVASEEELPRKLPRTDVPKLSDAEVPDVSWDFTPPPPDLDSKTVLERQNHPRTFQHIHTLRSHLSPVRALIACNSASTLSDETAFISAGDDSTVKFWRVSRIGPNPKKKGNFDILPQITFRGHTGIVTCLAESGGNIWSGGSDGGIRGWKVPSPTRDAYGSSGISLFIF